MSDNTDKATGLTWEGGVTPKSLRFDDPYFAQEDGRGETRHVFLSANGLPQRWQTKPSFTIAELGFGTGLNFFETLHQWQLSPGQSRELNFVSFERYPLSSDDMRRALSPWPELATLAADVLGQWPALPVDPALGEIHSFDIGAARLVLHIGDARDCLARWDGLADAWYLDGFSPARNPELWETGLMRDVFAKSAPDATLATYTVAGFVRRNLMAAGFELRKIPGFGRKRESLAGHRPII